MGKKSVARAAGEFALIVVGVMVALAGDSWLQSRDEDGLERVYLERISLDLERTLRGMASSTDAMDAIDAHARAVLRYLRGEERAAEPLQFVASAYHATRARFPTIADDAFVELSSGPGLALIDDGELRVQLVGFFQRSDRGPLPGIVVSDNVAYRDAVRRAIPGELQILIREECSAGAVPFSCDVEADPRLTEIALERLMADPNVRGSLNLWLQSVYQERRRVDSLIDRGGVLLEAIRE